MRCARGGMWLLTVTLAGVGCGARTGGLVPDPAADDDPFGLRDASFEYDGSSIDPGRRDTGSFVDEGFSFDTGLVRDSGLVRDEGVLPDDALLIETGPVPAPGCPPVLPKDGTACDFAKKLVCDYTGCDAKLPDHAECTPTNQWKVRASACATTPTGCPVALPADGTPCAVRDEFCWYDAECLGSALAICTAGRWGVKGPVCAAAGLCPPTLPAAGTACPATSKRDFECAYLNACGLYVWIDCRAGGGPWGTPSGYPCTAPAPCPPSAPTPGTPCDSGPGTAACAYPNACGSVDLYSCGTTWRFQKRGKCADAGCPTTPAIGSSCTSPGKECTYPFGGGCALDCSCAVDGAWSCKQVCGDSTSGG